jgi:hypothetical protein
VIKGKIRITKADYWTFSGININWNSGDYSEHMLKLLGGTGWIWENSEVWGAMSFANILVANSPSDWTIRKNVVHDTYGGEENLFRSHNIYVNTNLDAGPGLIEDNIFFNAPHGCNIKIAGPNEGAAYGSANVTVRYNTLYNAIQPLLIGDGSKNIQVYRNIVARGIRPNTATYLVRLYELTGLDDVVRDNLGYDAQKFCLDYNGGNYTCMSIDGGGTIFPLDPEFDFVGVEGFHPQNPLAQSYGRFAVH